MDRLANWSSDWQTLAMPVVLMLTGLVLTMADVLGILSLAEIQNLWPLALILIGLSELPPYQAGQSSGSSNARR